MKRPRLRGRWAWLGLLMVPALSWAVILALVPTEWARTRMADRLASATGRSVRIGALRLGVLGNLRILDVIQSEVRMNVHADRALEAVKAASTT